MRTAPTIAIISILALGLFSFSYADVVQPDNSVSSGNPDGSYQFNIGTGFSGSIQDSLVQVYAAYNNSGGNDGITLQLHQFSDSAYTTQVGTCYFTLSAPATSATTTGIVILPNSASGGSLGCDISSSSYIQILISGGSNHFQTPPALTNFYGTTATTSYPWVTNIIYSPTGFYGGSSAIAIPYFHISGMVGPANAIDWTQLNVSPPIPFNAITFATSSAGLFSAFSTTTIAAQCSTGNIFSDGLCAAGAFLFIPNPSILNSYVAIPQTEANNFPFSVISQVQSAFSGLSASSTANVPSYFFDYSALDLGTTTATGAADSMGNFLPSFQGLSTSSVLKYISPGIWDTVQALMAATLWLGFVLMVWFEVRKKFHHL